MMKKVILLLILFCCVVNISYAIGDDFTVRFFVGDDVQAPTAPSNVSATPVAQTQINLAWDASVDDLALGGYQVFRDASQIATTTLTSYSDSGLTASTTYSYFIRAFDTSYNISSSSNVVATTTYPITPTSTPTTTPTTSSGGSKNVVYLVSFAMEPTQYGVYMEWETSHYAQFELRWGRTASYELGFVVNSLFQKEHSTYISDLRPGTVYEFQLTARDRDGKVVVLKEGQFTTLDAPDTEAPANVLNLQATVFGNDVRLTWDNPTDPDFAYVRIVRNYLFYPTDIYDGFIVYQNNGSAFIDTGSLATRDMQYYTVFAYDTNGNISSGAVVVSRKVYQQESDIEEPPIATTTATIQFSDLVFLQHDEIVPSDAIDATSALTIRIAYEKLPEHLKAILVSLVYPNHDARVVSVLLRINKDKSFYEATIVPLQVVGTYPTQLSVYDYQKDILLSASGAIRTYKNDIPLLLFDNTYLQEMGVLLSGIILFLWLLLCMCILYFVYRAVRDGVSYRLSTLTMRIFSYVTYIVFALGAWVSARVLITLNMTLTSQNDIVFLGQEISTSLSTLLTIAFIVLTPLAAFALWYFFHKVISQTHT